MNFLELINKCLLELNYKQVVSFPELVKNEHKRIIQIMNILNKEICISDKWNFLLKKASFTLESGNTELDNEIPGRILYLYIDKEKYNFNPNFEAFISNKNVDKNFSQFGDKLLFPKFSKDTEVDVIYYTKNCVVDEQGNEKENLELENDKTLIPMPFSEPLLIYGTCMRLKANPQHVKFSYWMSMYKDALQNLRAKSSVCVNDAPFVSIHRK